MTESLSTDKKRVSYKDADMFMKIINELAGEQRNTKVDLVNIKFVVGKTRVILNGEISFDV